MISAVITFRNCIQTGYPFMEAILSHLPMVDEYLVNDGGSTDGTKEYVERLGEMFPKIKTYNIPDYKSKRWECVSEQYNELIKEASGDWIIQGNADEIIHENDLGRLKNFLETETVADVFKLPRREVCQHWGRLSNGTYWPSRIARNIPSLHQRWEAYGGDEFLDEAGWIKGEPRVKKIDVLIWHLYVVFPGNRFAKRKNDAEFVATEDGPRKNAYKQIKGKKFSTVPPKQIVDGLPALVDGLSHMLKYEVREELFDIDWLNAATGLDYS